ncbi:hypothetical protein BLNAU_18380 [Blattamonas nauphoetae]|uniref:Uncharacterized protein n=1 Tax=Blattamonas nauphoetae TaxID=2049346 RepID=A0ABQ9X532_9EUKA|nr:hypothetical protein BLNAU_18380 [Blattamonas nauphoetae]
MSNVDNCLYGTVIPSLGTSSSLICKNVSITECSNDLTPFSLPNEYTFFVNSPSDRSEFGIQQTDQEFYDCHFITNSPSNNFSIIQYNELFGPLSFHGCTFEVLANNYRVPVMTIKAQTEAFPLFFMDRCKVAFADTGTPLYSESQFRFINSPNTVFISSNFTSRPEYSPTTNIRAFSFQNSITFATITDCIFDGQSTSGDGACLHSSQISTSILISHSIFKCNTAELNGGCLYAQGARAQLFHCRFTNNSAGRRGGALWFIFPKTIDCEDVHFEENMANDTSSDGELTAYRGNDIHINAGNASAVTEHMVGCTSSSTRGKIGFYSSSTINGGVENEDVLLPHPLTPSLPTAAGEWWMVEGSDDRDCTEMRPCSSLRMLLDTILESEDSDGFHRININGTIEEEGLIPLSVELVGMASFMDSQTYTCLHLAMTVDGNVSFTSLTLSQKSQSSPILVMSSDSNKLRLANVQVHQMSHSGTCLFSLSGGSAIFHLCVIHDINLFSSAAIYVTGSCSLNMSRCWVSSLDRQGGEGGSVIDSSTAGTIVITDSDFTGCNSTGIAGCLSFSSTSSSRVNLTSVSFSNNAADSNLSHGPGSYGNDISFSDFTKTQITLVNVRSISNDPHSLTNTSSSSFDSLDLYFSNFGMDVPWAAHVEGALPLSRFTSVADIIMRTRAVGSVIITVQASTTFPLTNMKMEKQQIVLKSISLYVDLSSGDSVELNDSARLQLVSTQLVVDRELHSTTFVVSNLAELALYLSKIDNYPLTQSFPFISNQDGLVRFTSVTMNGGMSFQDHSFIESLRGTVDIRQTSFSHFSSTSDGAVMKANGTKILISDSSFVNCSAQHGGAFAVELSGAAYVNVNHSPTSNFNVTFASCRAHGGDDSSPTGKGGAIFVNGSSTVSDPIRFNLSSKCARFAQNMAKEGNDVYVSKTVFGQRSLDQIGHLGGISFSSNFRIVVEGRDSDELEKETVQNTLLPFPTVSVNGSVQESVTGLSGMDTLDCMWGLIPCATLTYAIGNLTPEFLYNSVLPQTIYFAWNMTYTERDIEVSSRDVTVVGTTSPDLHDSDITRSLISISPYQTQSYLFSIGTSARLKVQNLDIVASPIHGVFSLQPLGLSLELDNIAIVCFTGDIFMQPLLSANSGPINVSNCIFNTTQTSSNAAEFAYSVFSCYSENATITLQSTLFDSLLARTQPLLDLTSDKEVSLSKVQFVDCSGNNAINNSLICVSSSELDKVIFPSLWAETYTPETPFGMFLCRDLSLGSDDPFCETSLLFYLLRPANEVICEVTQTNESTHPNCGSSRLPCSSVDAAVNSANKHGIKQISVKTDIDHAQTIDISGSLAIASDNEIQRKVTQTTDALFKVSGLQSEYRLSWLRISLDSMNTISSYFVVVGARLTLTFCVIGEPTSPQCLSASMTSLFDVSRGATLNLTSTIITEVYFSHQFEGSLIHLSGGSVLYTDQSSKFSEIQSNGTGTIVYVESDDYEQAAQHPSFGNLIASIVLPIDSPFTYSEKNRFVVMNGLGKGESILWYWFPHTDSESSLHISRSGENHQTCGRVVLPCYSFHHGFNSLKKPGTTVTLHNDSPLSSEVITQPVEYQRDDGRGFLNLVENDPDSGLQAFVLYERNCEMPSIPLSNSWQGSSTIIYDAVSSRIEVNNCQRNVASRHHQQKSTHLFSNQNSFIDDQIAFSSLLSPRTFTLSSFGKYRRLRVVEFDALIRNHHFFQHQDNHSSWDPFTRTKMSHKVGSSVWNHQEVLLRISHEITNLDVLSRK